MAWPTTQLTPTSFALVALLVAVTAWLGTWLVLRILRRHEIFDQTQRPQQPQRAGAAWRRHRGGRHTADRNRRGNAARAGDAGRHLVAVGCHPAVVAAVSWADDLGHLSARLRLAIQALCVLPVLLILEDSGPIFQGFLPPLLDGLLAALAWLWFINLYNFMDGIDGMSATETASIGFGLAAVCMVSGELTSLAVPAALTGAAALGFLFWNWSPAKIFLGDVGSVPLGYFLGGLLLWAASQGHWEIAIILPLYYLVDATWTLLRRASRGGRFWEPHREHAYQRAVQGGLSHAAVVSRVLACNLLLVAAALAAAMGHSIVAGAMAALGVAILLWDLQRHALKS